MKPTVSLHLSQNRWLPTAKESRQRIVAAALSMTRGTHLEPSSYEQMLLEQFVQGKLTIGQVLEQLERHEQQ
jgi:hypothetical protein